MNSTKRARSPFSMQPPRRKTLARLRPMVALLLGLSSLAQAQLSLPSATTEVLERTGGTVEQIRRDLERDLPRRLENRLSATLPDRLPTDLELPDQPLGTLPKTLPILGAGGLTAFVDVEVEDGWRAVQYEWLVILAPGEVGLLKQLDARILEQSQLPELGLEMVRFRVSKALDSRAALGRVLPSDLVSRLDRNHIYNPQAGTIEPPAPVSPQQEPQCHEALKIGMVDTALSADHPGFAQANIVERNFLSESLSGKEGSGPPRTHGTAVAGLLVGSIDSQPARLPGATLYNASVFYSRNQYAQGATMAHLVKGLNWLAEADVSVINMSLTGPDNRILALAITRLTERGLIVVAAAGNEGPAAPPLYPAAYPQVIAVTAVDSERQIYRWANRGQHIDFAAPGVSVLTTRSGGDFGRESGTSMAAPAVAAHVACALASESGSAEAVILRLAKQAEDLGDRGRDPIFGHGLLY